MGKEQPKPTGTNAFNVGQVFDVLGERLEIISVDELFCCGFVYSVKYRERQLLFTEQELKELTE